MLWDKQADFLPLSQDYTVCNGHVREVSVCNSRIPFSNDHGVCLTFPPYLMKQGVHKFA